MTWIVIGCLLLLLLLGTAGMRAAGRLARGTWRPGAAMLALAAFVGAAGLGARQSWGASAVIFIVAVLLSMSARRTVRVKPTASGQPPPPRGSMSPEEARSILGVRAEASPEEVQAAYLKLIRLGHPDQGGTSGLAAQLNAARDVLLGKK
jgi:hypothetical protein